MITINETTKNYTKQLYELFKEVSADTLDDNAIEHQLNKHGHSLSDVARDEDDYELAFSVNNCETVVSIDYEGNLLIEICDWMHHEKTVFLNYDGINFGYEIAKDLY